MPLRDGKPSVTCQSKISREWFFKKEVTVDYDKRDRHGRIVGKVLLEGNDICIRQIEDGLAWHFKKYESEQPAMDRVKYSRAESDARAARVGLWRDPHPVPPWEFRKRWAGPGDPQRGTRKFACSIYHVSMSA
jgi:endonuclease YncB( thermonuclease family)